MDVIVPCKEGGKLTSRVSQNVPMKRINGQFLFTGAGLLKVSSGKSVTEK